MADKLGSDPLHRPGANTDCPIFTTQRPTATHASESDASFFYSSTLTTRGGMKRKAYDENRAQLLWYMRNCAQSHIVGRFRSLLREHMRRAQGRSPDEGDRAAISTARWRQLRRTLVSSAAARGDLAARYARFARTEFGLDSVETEILLLLMRYTQNELLESFVDEIAERLRNPPLAIATLVAFESVDIRRRLRWNAPLVASGLVCVEEAGSRVGDPGNFATIGLQLRRALAQSYETRPQLIAALTGPALSTDLTFGDFAHVGSTAELAARVLNGAVRQGSKGVNLLVYGPVGTGKTEFCKAIASRLGYPIWAVAEADKDGTEPSRADRLSSFRILERLLSARGEAVVLFDEAEDVLAQPDTYFGVRARGRTGSKVFINRLLENNAVPVLWTCNDVDSIDPAVLRRMTLAVELKAPPAASRAEIWRRALKTASVSLEAGAIARLSDRFEVAPAITTNCVRAAALSGGGESEIEQTLTGLLRLMGSGPKPMASKSFEFDPALVNCSEDVAECVAQLTRPGAPLDWSLCVSGPPGTGKSEFAQYLASCLKLEPVQKRASDLLGKYVGETERNIACAFAEAREQRGMLVFDEVDSLLSDRRNATRSWEVSQVNEMLTWMEWHPLPFVCTTNLMERVDSASLRRFTIKLQFEPLTTRQAALAFCRFFGSEVPRPLPDGLTPGDFANVHRRVRILGELRPQVLVDRLEQELVARGGSPKMRIGFVA